MQRRINALAMCVVSVLVTASASGGDWTRFRGPNGSGICLDDDSTPTRWSPTTNVKWKAALPGPGVSCPIVVGDRVYVTCYSGYGLDREQPGDQKNLKRHLVSIDRKTGKVIWTKTVDAVLPEDPFAGPGVPSHGYASHTPVSDGENVYVFFGKTGALAFDTDGKQLWQTSLGKESDPRRWGSASSPILYKNMLIVPATAESEALVALDPKTGNIIWRQEASGFSSSWSTPALVRVDDQRTDLVISVLGEIWGLNPETGKLRWYCESVKSDSVCSSVVTHDGVVYAIEGRSGGSIAVRAGGEGDVTQTHVLWKGRDSSRFPSPLFYKDRIYSFANSIGTCINGKTGERVIQLRLESGSSGQGRRMGGDYASPILADGKIYYLRQSGDMFVLKPNDKLELVAVNRVTEADEEFSATPAVSEGELFLRSNKHLYCVAPMGQEPSGPAIPKAVASAQNADSQDDADGGARRRGRRGGFDPAQMFQRRDTNGDGKLSGDEISERMRGNLDQLDTDKDGAVSLEEFRSGMSRFGGRGGGGGGRGGGNRGDAGPTRPERPQRPPLEKPAD